MKAQPKQTNRQNLFGNSQDTHDRNAGIVLIVAAFLICTVISCTTSSPERNTSWSNTSNVAGYIPKEPARKLDVPGLPNFYKVSDNLYRGAQPTAEGMRQLKKMGIKTVVNLRLLHSDRNEIGDTELTYRHIPMTAFIPKTSDVAQFLQIVTDSNCTPVFVHCQHGSDRTGLMCAIYRIVVQGWSKDEAIAEMTRGGFGFHGIFMNLRDYIRKLKVDNVKKRAGIKE